MPLAGTSSNHGCDWNKNNTRKNLTWNRSEEWISVIYLLALLIAKTFISIRGEDSRQRSRTSDTNGIRHKYIHSNPTSLGCPICQTDFASFFLSTPSSRGRYLACIYGKARWYINLKLLWQYRHNQHAVKLIVLENPMFQHSAPKRSLGKDSKRFTEVGKPR